MPGPGFWLVLGLVALVLSLGLTAMSYRVTEAVHAISAAARRQLKRDAEIFGEPTREDVEAPWLDEDTEELTWRWAPGALWLLPTGGTDDDVLFGDADAYFDTARFEAEILADLDALPTAWNFS